jgi:hypothetical protein
MCLLVSQPAGADFTDAFLLDVYAKNEDGLGIMYAEGGSLHVRKSLPASGKDFIEFYREHGSKRNCIWHARMKTHGDIDIENCHPYQVTADIWMAHNGILSTGNDADRAKSDTWHFIKNVLGPALTADPDLLLDLQWIDFMGHVIGSSNKFGLLRADGVTCIINRRSGVEFSNSWLSNTYAWTPSRFGFRNSQSQQKRPPGDQSLGFEDDYRNDYAPWKTMQRDWRDDSRSQSKRKPNHELETELSDSTVTKVTSHQLRKFVRSAYNQWLRHGLTGIEDWVCEAPSKAAQVLAHWYDDMEINEMIDLVHRDPDQAAEWIEDLFRSDSVTPSWLS